MALALFVALLLQEQSVEWVRKLGSDRIEEREKAAGEIRKLGASALPELERAAGDVDPEVAGRARRLGSVIRTSVRLSGGLKAALPGVEERLVSGGSRAWTEAFLEASAGKADLGGLFPEAIEGLESTEEAYFVLREIERRRVTAAGEGVLRLLEGEGEICRAAVHTLLKLGWNRPSPQVIRLLESPDPYKRRIPLWAFREIEMGSLAPDVVRLLDSPIPDTRVAAIRAVGEFRLKEGEARLLEMSASLDVEDELLDEVASSLGKIGTAETVAALVPLLRSREEGARKGAALALGELDALGAVSPLLGLLRDPNGKVRAAAVAALGRMNALEAVPDLLRLSREPGLDHEERLGILGALVDLRVKDAVPGLELLLESERPWIRGRAIDGLGTLGARESAAKIARFLREKVEPTELLNVQASAVYALGRIEAEEAVPLLKGLEGGSVSSALCRLGVRERAHALIDAVEGFHFGLKGGPMDEEDGEWAPLDALNALREPELWQDLRRRPVRGTWRGSTRELLARIAEQAGMALEVPETRYWKEDLWLRKSGRIRSRLGQVPVLEALRELLPGEPYAFVLEPGRIRVVGIRDAIAFWKEWAAKR